MRLTNHDKLALTLKGLISIVEGYSASAVIWRIRAHPYPTYPPPTLLTWLQAKLPCSFVGPLLKQGLVNVPMFHITQLLGL